MVCTPGASCRASASGRYSLIVRALDPPLRQEGAGALSAAIIVKFRGCAEGARTGLQQSIVLSNVLPGDLMTKKSRPLAALVALAIGAAATPVGALLADASTQDLMKARHDHYHKLGDAFKKVRDEVRGSEPDMAGIKRAAQFINDASQNQAKWFPAGSGPEAGKTRALTEIWSKPQEFDAAQKAFSDAAPKLLAAANADDVSAVKARFGEVGKACKNCHDSFRSPEEHD
jgi:cytochrome c556